MVDNYLPPQSIRSVAKPIFLDDAGQEERITKFPCGQGWQLSVLSVPMRLSYAVLGLPACKLLHSVATLSGRTLLVWFRLSILLEFALDASNPDLWRYSAFSIPLFPGPCICPNATSFDVALTGVAWPGTEFVKNTMIALKARSAKASLLNGRHCPSFPLILRSNCDCHS